MVERLGTIMCYVSDMSRAVAFYRDACGLPLQVESPGWSQFDLGNGAAIGLHPFAGGVRGGSPVRWRLDCRLRHGQPHSREEAPRGSGRLRGRVP